MANPYTDQRALLARLQQNSSRAFDPGIATATGRNPAAVRLGTAASNFAINNPALRAQIDAIAAGKPTGAKGVLAGVLGNPIARTVLKPLEILAIPGRAVIAGGSEIVDRFDTDPKTKASWGDFTKKVKDPTYGFGKTGFLHTDNKWLDRVIGFVGDVALDPVTYLSFGAGKFAGFAGHLDMAKEVLKVTNDAALASRVAKYGRGASGLTDEVLQGIGANRHGLYFLGKRTGKGVVNQGLRVPGTGAIGQLSDVALSRIRTGTMGTRAGKLLQKVTMTGDDIAAKVALRQGTLATSDGAAAVLSYLSASPVERMAFGRALQDESQKMVAFQQMLKNSGGDAYADTVHRLITDDSAYRLASSEEQRVADLVRAKFAEFETNVDALRQAVDPDSPPFGMKNYFPMMQTEDAIRYRMNPTNTHSRDLNLIYARDPLEGGRNFKTRTLEKDDIFFGHKLTQQDIDGGITRLNEIAVDGGFVGKFFETDVNKVLSQYVPEYAKEIGMLSKHKHLLDTGFWTRADNVMLGESVFDTEMINKIKKQVGTLSGDMRKLHADAVKSHLGLVDALNQYRTGLSSTLDELTSAKGALGGREALAETERVLSEALNGNLIAGADELKILADNLGDMKKGYAALMGLDISNGKLVIAGTEQAAEDASLTLGGIIQTIDNIQSDVVALHDELWALEQNYVGKELAAQFKEKVKQFDQTIYDLQEANARIETTLIFANQLEGALEAIISGNTEVISNLPLDVIRISALMTRDGQIGSDAVKEWINEQFDISGRTTDKLSELVNTPGGLYEQVSGVSKIEKTAITKMKVAEFYRMLPRLFTGELELDTVREIGVYALLMDDILYRGNVPTLLQPLRNDVVTALEEAGQAQNVYASLVKQTGENQRISAKKIFEQQWKPAYDAALLMRRDLSDMEQWIAEFSASLRSLPPEQLDRIVPGTAFEGLFSKYPFLEDLFPPESADSFFADLMGTNVSVGNKEQYFVQSQREFTFGELLQRVEDGAARFRAALDEPSFTVGVGATQKSYSGNDVIARFNRMREIEGRLGDVADRRRREIQSLLKGDETYRASGLDTEAGVARYGELKLKAQKVRLSSSEKQEMNLFERAQARAEQIKTEVNMRVNPEVDAELRLELDRLTGGGGLERPGWFDSVGASQEKLANAILQYQIASEVGSRFKAVAVFSEAYGYTPSQAMFTRIVQGVQETFEPMVQRQIDSAREAIGIMKSLDEKMAVALNDNFAKGQRVATVFQSVMKSLSDRELEILHDTIGHRVSWVGDAYTLGRKKNDFIRRTVSEAELAQKSAYDKEIAAYNKRYKGTTVASPEAQARIAEVRAKNAVIRKKILDAENQYYNTVVSDWYRSAYPDEAARFKTRIDKKVLKAALKRHAESFSASAASAYRTPWSEDATIADVKDWFSQILGESSVPGRKRPGVVYASEIETKIRNLKRVRRQFAGMVAPDMDRDMFFFNPGQVQKTPSYFAQLLQDHADDIERQIGERLGIQAEIGTVRAEAGQIAEEIKGMKIAGAALRAGEAPLPESVAKPIIDARYKATQILDAQKNIDSVLTKIESMKQTHVPRINELKTLKRWPTVAEREELKTLLAEVEQAKVDLKAARDAKKKLPKLTAKEKALVPNAVTGKDRLYSGSGDAVVESIRADLPKEASDALAEYTRRMASRTHGKALIDERMHRVLDALAQYDLSKVTSGFTMDGETWASLPDGTRIVFSDAEWRSLFRGTPKGAEWKRGGIIADISNTRDELKVIEKNIAEAQTMLSRVESARRETIDRLTRTSKDRGLDVHRGAIESWSQAVDNHRLALDDLIRQRDALRGRIDELKYELQVYGKGTQESALMKLRYLTEGSKTHPPVFDETGLGRWLRGEHPTLTRAFPSNKLEFDVKTTNITPSGEEVVQNARRFYHDTLTIEDRARRGGLYTSDGTAQIRRTALNSAWEENESSKWLQEMRKLESNSFMSMYKFKTEELASRESYLRSLRSTIKNLSNQDSEVGAAIVASRSEAQDVAVSGNDELLRMGAGPVTDVTAPVKTGPPDYQLYNRKTRKAMRDAARKKAAEDKAAGIVPEPKVKPKKLGTPRTPEEMRLYAERMREQAVPGGPLLEPIPGVANVKLQAEADALVGLQSRAEAQLAEAVQAETALADWNRGGRVITGPPTTSEEWLRRASELPAGQRKQLTAEVTAAWKARTKSLETAQSAAQRLKTNLESTQAEIAAVSGWWDNGQTFWEQIYQQRGIADSLRQQIEEVDLLLRAVPGGDSQDIMRSFIGRGKKGPKPKPEEISQALELYRAWADTARPVFEKLAQEPDNPAYKAWAAAAVADSAMIDLELQHAEAIRNLAVASIPQWKTTVVTPLDKGFDAAVKQSGILEGKSRVDARMFPSIYGNTEALDIIKSVERIRIPGVADDLARFMRGYTGFFRAYATLSPGYHVRNEISNVFSIFSAGADIRNMYEGFHMWRTINNGIKQGRDLTEIISSFASEKQQYVRVAADIMYGMNGGKTANAMEGFVRGGSKITDNMLISSSRKAGNYLESSSHFILAYDSLVKGFTPEQAFNRTKRYLIDYSEKTILDETMREIIPFWTWMSRNLPLQIVNRWANPKPYLIYEKLMKNMRDEKDATLTPDWLSKRGAVAIGGGTFLNPDVPTSGLEQQISDLTNPSKWLSYVNPGIKTPIELMTNRNTFTGQSFDDAYVPVSAAIRPLLPLLEAMGQVEHNAKGEPVVKRKAVYALESLIPPLSRADRLFPAGGGTTSSQNATLGFLGIPITNVGQNMQNAEAYRRQAQMQALVERNKQIREA